MKTDKNMETKTTKPAEKADQPEWLVAVARIGYSHKEFWVHAGSRKEAKEKVMAKVGNAEFTESDADYEMTYCSEQTGTQAKQ